MSEGSAGRGPSARTRTPEAPGTASSGFELEFPAGSRTANASVRALVRTSGAVMTTFSSALPDSLSASGRQALAVLENAGRPMSPTEISGRLLVTTASMTSLLDTLEGRGLVTRTRDTTDRRKQLVSLTEAGQRVVDEFLPRIVAVQTAMMAGLSEDDREHLMRCLAVIRENLDRMDAAAVAAAAPPRGPHHSR